MKEQRADLFMFYHDKREAVERFAAYASLGFLLLAAMSRSVVTRQTSGTSETKSAEGVKDALTQVGEEAPATWDYLFGGIDNSYVVIIGPVVIAVVAIWFNRVFSSCLRLRQSLIETIKDGKLGDNSLNSLEVVMTTAPMSCAADRPKALRGFLPRSVFVVGLGCVIMLLWEYATFRPEGSSSLGWLHVWIGQPYLQGFEPVWPRYGPEKPMPWIYPPWYTIGYAGIVIYLGSKILRPPSEKREYSRTPSVEPPTTSDEGTAT